MSSSARRRLRTTCQSRIQFTNEGGVSAAFPGPSADTPARSVRDSMKRGDSSVQTSISIRHGNLSEASQKKLRSKIEKLHRLFDRLSSIEVTVDLSSDEMPRVDLNVSAEHKHD